MALKYLGSFEGALFDEEHLHSKFAESRRHGEWFLSTPELRALVIEKATLVELQQDLLGELLRRKRERSKKSSDQQSDQCSDQQIS